MASLAATSLRPTAAIRPVPRVVPWARLRILITLTASASVRILAAQAAATSPTLWPIVRSCRMPRDASTRVRPTWIANSSGWAFSVAASQVSSTPARIASTSEALPSARQSASTSSSASRNSGDSS